MPLTAKGREVLHQMEQTYPTEKKAEEVFYASKNSGRITGVDAAEKTGLDEIIAACESFDANHGE